MARSHRSEIDRNFDFFRRNLSALLHAHRGSYVLLRHAGVIDFYDSPGEAYRAGLKQFPDELFSVQRISDEPVELGHMSFAFD